MQMEGSSAGAEFFKDDEVDAVAPQIENVGQCLPAKVGAEKYVEEARAESAAEASRERKGRRGVDRESSIISSVVMGVGAPVADSVRSRQPLRLMRK